MLGRSWEVLGDAAKAAAAYARALSLEPDHPETLLRGGLAAAQAGDAATAKSRLRHLLTLIPAEHEAHDRVREAIDRLERAGGSKAGHASPRADPPLCRSSPHASHETGYRRPGPPLPRTHATLCTPHG